MFRILIIVSALMLFAASKGHELDSTSDSYIRDRVLLLTGNQMSCTGVSIKTLSGKELVLSAAHCAALAINGKITAQSEDGMVRNLQILKVDQEHDLLLLSKMDNRTVDVAKDLEMPHQKIHTLTHGRGFPTYRTDGELLDEREVWVQSFPIFDAADEEKCTSVSYQRVEMSWSGVYCTHKLIVMMTNAMIVPGSSGGPVLNKDGELVGIVSCSDGVFGGMVPLHIIHEFLKDQ